MIKAIYRKLIFKISSIWFLDDIDDLHDKSDITFIHGYNGVINNNYIVNKQKTLITSLEENIDDLFMKISKNCRYDIKKASLENLNVEFFDSNSLIENKKIILEFYDEYKRFTKAKKIKNTFNKNAVFEYIKNSNLILSKVKSNGVDYAQHIYVCDGSITRLLYSVSNFRDNDLNKDIVGRANKFLHFEDINYFKENNYSSFDWGGVSSFDEPNGVDKFKKSFGGINHTYSNVIIINNKILKFVLKFIHKR